MIEAFKIPSGSMLPTLAIGDHIFVNKFIYGLASAVYDDMGCSVGHTESKGRCHSIQVSTGSLLSTLSNELSPLRAIIFAWMMAGSIR